MGKKWATDLWANPISAPEGKGEKWEGWNFPCFSPRNKDCYRDGGQGILYTPGQRILSLGGKSSSRFPKSGWKLFKYWINPQTPLRVWCSHFSPVDKSLKLLCALWSLCSIMGTLSNLIYINTGNTLILNFMWSLYRCARHSKDMKPKEMWFHAANKPKNSHYSGQKNTGWWVRYVNCS